jgi:hypothetical protein
MTLQLRITGAVRRHGGLPEQYSHHSDVTGRSAVTDCDRVDALERGIYNGKRQAESSDGVLNNVWTSAIVELSGMLLPI